MCLVFPGNQDASFGFCVNGEIHVGKLDGNFCIEEDEQEGEKRQTYIWNEFAEHGFEAVRPGADLRIFKAFFEVDCSYFAASDSYKID